MEEDAPPPSHREAASRPATKARRLRPGPRPLAPCPPPLAERSGKANSSVCPLRAASREATSPVARPPARARRATSPSARPSPSSRCGEVGLEETSASRDGARGRDRLNRGLRGSSPGSRPLRAARTTVEPRGWARAFAVRRPLLDDARGGGRARGGWGEVSKGAPGLVALRRRPGHHQDRAPPSAGPSAGRRVSPPSLPVDIRPRSRGDRPILPANVSGRSDDCGGGGGGRAKRGRTGVGFRRRTRTLPPALSVPAASNGRCHSPTPRRPVDLAGKRLKEILRSWRQRRWQG